MNPLWYTLFGLALGLIIGWLLRSLRPAKSVDNRLETELREQVERRESELAQTRAQLTESSNARATAEATQMAAERLLVEQRQIHEQNLRETTEAREKALADLRAAFKSLSVDTLRELQPQFIERVSERVDRLQEASKGDLAQRQQAIATLIEPLKQQLETYQQRLQQAENAQAGTLGEVRKQLDTLAKQSQTLAQETLQFRMVLKSNQARGRWGEETLRRVIEAAGMSAHCDFSEQTKEGDSMPDLVVRLPGERFIIVDAKVPEFEFLSALETADTLKRSALLVAHAAKLKNTPWQDIAGGGP